MSSVQVLPPSSAIWSPPLSNEGTSELQYLDLIRLIEAYGVAREDRTGVGTKAIHGVTLRFDLSGGVIPLLTTKKMMWKSIVHELMWFLRGETNIRPLLEKKVTIWSEWPYKRYLHETGETLEMKAFEQRIVEDAAFARAWGDLGPVYGKQWRFWQGPDGKIYDQIADLVKGLRTTPTSRRLLFHGWNVADVDTMALPPCHLLYQCFVADGKLSLSLYQRSCDVGLGLPFNLASAAVLVHLLAHHCGLEPGTLVWYGHDVHVYHNHWEGLTYQTTQTPKPFPRLNVQHQAQVPHVWDYDATALIKRLEGYVPGPTIVLPIAV